MITYAKSRFHQYLRSRKGESYVLAAALVLTLLLMLTFSMSFASSVSAVESQRSAAKYTLDQYVVLNAQKIYENIRNQKDDTDTLDATQFRNYLVQNIGLEESAGTLLYKTNNGVILYKIRNVELRFKDPNTAKLELSYIISVPLEFNGAGQTWIDVPVLLTSRYLPKF